MYPLSTPLATTYQSDYHLEELLESLDDVLVATDNNFMITKWNKAAERVYGFTAKEAVGVRFSVLIRNEILGTTLEEAIKTIKDTNRWKGVFKYTTCYGEDIYMDSSSTAIRNEDGFVMGYVAIQRDVTKRFVSEQSLQKFAAILHSLDESFLLVNQGLKVIFLSPKKNVQRFHNSNYKVGDDALLYIPDNEKAGILADYKRAFAGDVITREANSGGDEESRIYLHVTYMPVKNSFDIISNVAVIIKDLTEEKRRERLEIKQREAEAQLHKSRMLFEQFMENCPLPAWITDESGVMQYMNPTYTENVQITKEDIGRNINELFPKIIADDYYANNMQVMQNNKAVTVIEKGVGSEGNIVTYLINKFPLLYDDKRMVAGWAMDITEQMKLQGKLEEINSSKTKILSVIGHDLRSPLTVIHAIGKMMADGITDFSGDELTEMIQAITDSSAKAMRLLADLVLWCQNQNEKVTYCPQSVDMSEVISDSASLYDEEAAKKGITLSYSFIQTMTAHADKEMVKTVMRNLISNAIKFSPAGGTISVSAAADDQSMYLSIADEGNGIEEALRNCILKGTNSTSTHGTSGEKGMGVGLSLSKDFIEKNNGVMTILNNKTRGTTFSFSLPLWKETLPV